VTDQASSGHQKQTKHVIKWLESWNSNGALHAAGRIPSLAGCRGMVIRMMVLGHGKYSINGAILLWPPRNGGLGINSSFC